MSRSGRTRYLLFAALAVMALAVSACAAGLAAPVAAASTGQIAQPTATRSVAAVTAAPGRTITVVGLGEVQSEPDIARTSIGIEVVGATVADAMAEARTRMDAVLAALKAAGIAEKDIRTNNFSINFERQGPEPIPSPATRAAPVRNGLYRVSNMVEVTVRDLEKVGAVIDAATGAGANNVWGINFALEETTGIEAEAREKAVDDARARAESLARLSGVQLGQIVSVSEVIGQQVPMLDTAAAARGMGGGGTPVQPGELTFSTRIQAVFAIQ